ncbi:uncharacterized protein STEHIDRAFT_70516 [Stereum hirsutum FP-91666 SS1]|uniref:uncharacterized protein n=1 Tax=Stereum hirsutum (strain FP-91666) TaxID=721885 RepID=UPI000440CAD0|nr:uncharacterized protein STEHIDRAFT_70516 [Stereum hirsutum FP-91666 SS1]EIM92049.1 hypothetical protein STEHIDRAFT_70516 [Stereum hirsutum FP-91666 SS1]
MELGSHQAAKVEPFVLMSKSAKGAAAAKLVQDATSAPGLFVFAELLDVPSIQELANNPTHSSSYTLLQLFAYKTYQDYLQHKDSLPPLSQTQITKLRHLSLVTFSMQRRILPYSDLLSALEISNIRELEDLIIDAIYLDILRGKLDQKEQQFEVEYTMGRDLEPGSLGNLLGALQDWSDTTSSVLSVLDASLARLSSQSAQRAKESEEHERLLNQHMKEVQDKNESRPGGTARRPLRNAGSARSGGGGSERLGEDVEMEIDEVMMESMSKGKNRKAPQETMSKPRNKRNRL